MSVVRYSGGDQTNVKTLALPEVGAYNGALLLHPHRPSYICVYRARERTFAACELDLELSLRPRTHVTLELPPCVDPRPIRHRDRTWLLFSVPSPDATEEAIWVAEMHTGDGGFGCGPAFPLEVPRPGRQKSWMPFSVDDSLFLISDVHPHTVWRVDGLAERDPSPVMVAEEPWPKPPVWLGQLRGNASPLRLDPGRFLGTFHVCVDRDGVWHYENGCYVFEATPPFRVRACATAPYLGAADACAPMLRRQGEVRVTFPLAVVPAGEDLLISYGDNDSAVKVVRTTLDALLADVRPLSQPG